MYLFIYFLFYLYIPDTPLAMLLLWVSFFHEYKHLAYDVILTPYTEKLPIFSEILDKKLIFAQKVLHVWYTSNISCISEFHRCFLFVCFCFVFYLLLFCFAFFLLILCKNQELKSFLKPFLYNIAELKRFQLSST